ncbi:DUF6765 family protein [Dyella choica]|uniref:Uncharacterized protein n=1 Tax=Dyella choica TaxID=1927959 RepID=A0A3S0PJL2_9GAMM|nr:DUF6765 family protein [Dyella choica]RUL77506.1 hypothetical protein EKH80_06335 [Dyella choica]
MNNDFHYGVIYILARLAQYDRESATTIAHACQYVDDSTVTGVLDFAGGESFDRFASAHAMYDYLNWVSDSAKRVWAPFHFLPACEGQTFDEKCVCRPNSRTAREMVKETIRQNHAENGLHRLGVTLHVYVDTWAHQKFSGTISANNIVNELRSEHHEPTDLLGQLRKWVGVVEDATENAVAGLITRLGHGAALHLPDLPWAKWRYVNGHEQAIQRDNLPDFMTAADMAFRAIKGFQSGQEDFENLAGLTADAKTSLENLLRDSRSEDSDERLRHLMEEVAKGSIHGLREEVPEYVAKGEGSWKFEATGIDSAETDGLTKPVWQPKFEHSDYRKFHDAVKQHRAYVMGTLLPSHGVRLA